LRSIPKRKYVLILGVRGSIQEITESLKKKWASGDREHENYCQKSGFCRRHVKAMRVKERSKAVWAATVINDREIRRGVGFGDPEEHKKERGGVRKSLNYGEWGNTPSRGKWRKDFGCADSKGKRGGTRREGANNKFCRAKGGCLGGGGPQGGRLQGGDESAETLHKVNEEKGEYLCRRRNLIGF